jgi:hypothetical protein
LHRLSGTIGEPVGLDSGEIGSFVGTDLLLFHSGGCFSKTSQRLQCDFLKIAKTWRVVLEQTFNRQTVVIVMDVAALRVRSSAVESATVLLYVLPTDALRFAVKEILFKGKEKDSSRDTLFALIAVAIYASHS